MAHVYDVELAILGGGPAGYLAAVRAAQLGVSVAIVEREEFGGVCLNRGCIPTKALLRTVELAALGRRKDGLVDADYVLLAVGRKPAVPAELIALGAATGVQGALVVNEHMETNIPGIYAAGDVTGGKLLAHKAYAEGRVAVENAVGASQTLNYQAVPSCVYIQPELATVGMNEAEAAAQGREVRTGRFYFRNNGRALALGEREGLVKVVADSRTHTVLGAQIFGPQATELISELTLAVSLGLRAEVLADLVHPHPTLSEAVMEACADAVGRAIHKA